MANDETIKMGATAQKACNGLRLFDHEMSCNKEFSPIECENCDYYYVFYYSSCDVPKCLKHDIKNWALYRILKEMKNDGGLEIKI